MPLAAANARTSSWGAFAAAASYYEFSGVSQPEKIVGDTVPLNSYNAGDCFEDVNGNNAYDTDRGRSGTGIDALDWARRVTALGAGVCVACSTEVRLPCDGACGPGTECVVDRCEAVAAALKRLEEIVRKLESGEASLDEAMRSNYWSAVYATLRALPHLQKQGRAIPRDVSVMWVLRCCVGETKEEALAKDRAWQETLPPGIGITLVSRMPAK